MKIQIISLLSISFICISKCQNIITPTNYTLSYLENIDMLQMKCKFDSDCPQYSKCENITNGDKTYNICKFGDFLCPESTDDYFTNSNVNESCVYVDATMYDLDKEEIKEGFSKDIKPILKTCGHTVDCTTETCNKNSDCLSGMCTGNKCKNGDNMNHEIYRCSADDQNKFSMKCKKVNGMKCSSDSECYSNNCTSGGLKYYDWSYCSKPGYTSLEKYKHNSAIIIIIIFTLSASLSNIFCGLYYSLLCGWICETSCCEDCCNTCYCKDCLGKVMKGPWKPLGYFCQKINHFFHNSSFFNIKLLCICWPEQVV